MRLFLRIKLITFLLIGLFSTFYGEIKSEEACYYTTRQDYKKCKREGGTFLPKYPIENFHSDQWLMGEGIANTLINYSVVGQVYDVVEFQAYKKEKLQITLGTKSHGFMWGLSWRNPWIEKKTFDIDPKRIISLEKNDKSLMPGWPRYYLPRKYKFKYLDSYGEVKTIKFDQMLVGNKKEMFDMIGDYLMYVSDLKWGDQRSVALLIENTLKDNEKFLIITKSIILDRNNSTKNKCFIAKDSKFPELTARYKNLYKTINPLRAKLDLPTSNEIKPICD